MRDRTIVIGSLVAVIAGSWAYLLAGAGTGMSTLEMSSWRMALGLGDAITTPVAWNARYAGVMLGMWWIMMVAMMLPSASPMIVAYNRMSAKPGRETGDSTSRPALRTAIFTTGYLLVWGVFSAIATGLQWAFELLGVLSPMMMNSTSQLFAGVILLGAGLYQLTPLKQACLTHCRSPMSFLINQWRDGHWGALRMGAQHGLYCLGCCWGLMAILFFGGIMNLYWIIGLALIVLIEKVMTAGSRFSVVLGTLLAIWGGLSIVRAMTN